jgi:phosphoribosyl 1,2-cyclic phosphodiesterase
VQKQVISPRQNFCTDAHFSISILHLSALKLRIGTSTHIKFWGVRGSIPTPGPGTVRYGGNTSCIEFRCGKDIIILDAGTGLRLFGQSLLQEFKRGPLNLTLLVSHTHWDHIQGLPFFAPIYEPRCRLRILGGEGSRTGLENALTGQMESTYFPVPFSRLPSNIEIQELQDFSFAIGPVLVRAHRANHPGITAGYRLFSPDGIVVFLPDAEPPQDNGDLIEFIRDADVLILDSQYDRAEYKQHTGWGHGCVDDSVALALKAGVKKLFLFHHDPGHDDKKIDAFVRHARKLVAKAKSKMKVEAACEGLVVPIGGK